MKILLQSLYLCETLRKRSFHSFVYRYVMHRYWIDEGNVFCLRWWLHQNTSVYNYEEFVSIRTSSQKSEAEMGSQGYSNLHLTVSSVIWPTVLGSNFSEVTMCRLFIMSQFALIPSIRGFRANTVLGLWSLVLVCIRVSIALICHEGRK